MRNHDWTENNNTINEVEENKFSYDRTQ